MNRKIIWLSVFYLSVTAMLAQTGRVVGVVKEAGTNETIPFANVLVKGTPNGVVTDLDGKYELKLKPGTYDITFMFLGYEEFVKKGVVIAEGQTVTVNATLVVASFKLDDVVVTSTRVTNTEMAVMIEMRKSEQIVSGISNQQIRKGQDNDAAEVVKRIPGVTITDDRFIVVRGLNNRYNNVLLNGVIAPSIEADSRAFSFDLIPSALLDRMLVFKSGSPDIPGDFAGALVKIYTKNTVEANYDKFQVFTGVRSGTTFSEVQTATRQPLDKFGMGQINRATPDGLVSNLQDFNFQPDLFVEQAKLFDNDWATKNMTALPDGRFRYELGRLFQLNDGKTLSLMNSVAYANTHQAQTIQRNRWRDYDSTGQSSPWFNYSDQRYSNNVRMSLVNNWALKTNKNNIYEFRNLLVQMGGLETVLRTGTNDVEGSDVNNISYRYESRFIYSGQLQGTHTLNEGRAQLTWVGGFSASNRQEPDWRRAQSRRPKGSEDDFQVVIQSSANQQNSSRFYSFVKERAGTFTSDYEYIINPEKNFKIKTGIFTEYKERGFNARTLSYIRASNVLDPLIENQPLEEIYSPENMRHPDGLMMGENTKFTDSYDARNILAAAYVSSSYKITRALSVAGGLRFEYNLQQMETARPSATQDPITAELLGLNPLPYVNASYTISDRALIRGSFGIHINRPEFRELAPFAYYSFDLASDVVGNPNLKNANITSYDVRWEFYPTASEVISAGLFYKNFINPIEFIILSGASNPVFVYNNADQAQAYGFEAEIRKNLSFISPSLDKFTLMLNATLIRSEIDLGEFNQERQQRVRPLQGQSPYIINAGIFYAFKRSQFNVQYNVSGRRIFLVGDVEFPTQWEIARHMVDLTYQINLTEKMEFKIGVTDLLNSPYGVVEDGNQDGKINNKLTDKSIINTRFGQYVQAGLTFSL